MILWVTDNQEMGEMWCQLLSQRINAVTLTHINHINHEKETPHNPSLITIIDLYSPTPDYKQVLKDFRTTTKGPLLILMTVHHGEQVLDVYEAGADDCIHKPFDPQLLLAKVVAWSQRMAVLVKPKTKNGLLQVGKVAIDLNRKCWISENGETIKLTPLEFKLLSLLMRHPDRVLELPTIIQQVWGYTKDEELALVRHLIYRVRRKIEPLPDEPQYIISVFGSGYKFESAQA